MVIQSDSVAQVIIADFVDLTRTQPERKSKSRAKNKRTDHVQEHAKDVYIVYGTTVFRVSRCYS